MSIFGVGISALSTAQAGLLTTGHNISNANTTGFNRQQIVQNANTPLFSGGGYIGQGVQVTTVKRLYNDFVADQLRQEQTQGSYLDSYLTQVTQLDDMLADTSAGLSPSLQDFFTNVNGIAGDPSSIPARQSLLSGAQSMVARFQALNNRMQEIRNGVNGQITSSVGSINGYAQQIAYINKQIMLTQASSSQPANDLLDQRDQLISDLSKEINVTVLKQDNGDYNIFMGNGQSLVLGQQAFTLSAAPSAADPQQLDVYLVNGAGSSVLAPSSLQGGTLGGVLAFRSEMLDSAQNALGRVAIGLAQTLNDQHQLGQDLNGALGGTLFNMAVPKVISNTNNAVGGTVTASFSDVGLLTTSDYKMVATGAATFTLTRLSDGAVVTPASEGLTINLAGATAGDSWLVEPTRNGARDISLAITDPTKIAAAAPIIGSATLANAGSGAISAGSVNTPPPPNANLQQPVTITFTGAGTFDVTGVGTGNPVGVAYTPGGNITYNGWTVQISGAPVAGDTFTVGPNTGGVSDGRNALQLAALQTATTLDQKTTSYQGAYGRLVSLVGNKTREIQVTNQAQTNLVSQTQQAQQSLSGVNMDEEAANLMRYQQAYQAAAKMIQVATTCFDTVLGLGK
ncbi:MAG: flagellar hook-associated protein FlgK [Sulfuricella sp.]|nr:flagellar hook-associated protein FlgK [Sulfuricella sp.]